MDDDSLRLLAELHRGAKLAFENAEELYSEAVLLKENGHLSRALTLHQISMEECAKVDIIGAWATNLVCGGSVDVKKLTAAIRSHKAKNYTNAYMSGISEAEQAAREAKDWEGSSKAFKERQAEIHAVLNTNKNASMYVDFHDTTFVAPRELIDEEMAEQIGILNQYFLTITKPRLGALARMLDQPDVMERVLSWFTEVMKGISPDEFETQKESLFQDLFERYRKDSQ